MLYTHPCIFTTINKPTYQSMNIPIFYSVPQPDVNIILNLNAPLYAGNVLTLTCTVTLDPHVDNIMVAIQWSGPSNRYSITPIVNSSRIYTSNLTISHTETQDNGIYTCTVTITGGHYVQQAVASDSVSITVDEMKQTGMQATY